MGQDLGLSRRTINPRNMSREPTKLTRRQLREIELQARVKRRAWHDGRAREYRRVHRVAIAVVLLVFLPAYLVLRLIPPSRGPTSLPWWPFALLGGAFFVLGLRLLVRQLHAARWPWTTCRIEFADTVAEYTRAGVGWHPVVSYVYEVGGREYTNDVVRMVDGDTSAARVRAHASRYAPGSIQRCYFNPANPQEAVLERDVRLDVPLLFMVVGLGMPVWVYLSR